MDPLLVHILVFWWRAQGLDNSDPWILQTSLKGWMLLYLYCITYFHISNIEMFFLHLDFWAIQFIIQSKSQSVSLDNLGRPLSSVNVHRLFPNFQLQLGGYFSPPTRVPSIARWQYLLEHHMLVLFESTQSNINQLELII